MSLKIYSKTLKKCFKKGVSLHLQEFGWRGPKIFRVTPLGSHYYSYGHPPVGQSNFWAVELSGSRVIGKDFYRKPIGKTRGIENSFEVANVRVIGQSSYRTSTVFDYFRLKRAAYMGRPF